MHGEVMLELKLAGNHLDREQVERALLRRQARQVQRVSEQEAVWFDEEPLWVVAPHLPGWLHDMRKPSSSASGCYWIEPQWRRFLWIAANELPLCDELIPFLLARSGQKLDEFAKWAADRRPLEWTMNMLDYLPMSTITQEELLARFDPVDDPEIEARRQRIVRRLLDKSPQVKEELREEGRKEGRIHTLREVLRSVLASRQIVPDERNDARILACSDVATLERWLARALTARGLADVLD